MTHKEAILELAGMVKVLALHILITTPIPASDPRQRQMLEQLTTRADEIVAGINGRTLENAA